MNRYSLVAIAMAVAAAGCGRQGLTPPVVVAPRQPAGATSAAQAASADASAVSNASADSPSVAIPSSTEPAASDAPRPRATNSYSPNMPESDPVGPMRPRCPNVAALVKASAVMKHEYPSARRRPVPPSVLDIELTITIAPNPGQVTFAANRLSVFGGVLVEEMFQPTTPGKDVLLIRPMGGVALETSLMVLFGLVCKDRAADGSLRVPMKAAIPWRDGEPVTVDGIQGY